MIRAADAPISPQAQPFPLADVRLLDGPFKSAQDVNARYLLEVVNVDRLLAGFRAQAKLPAKAERYGGWEARGINGHSLGHYLSAVSALYAATGDPKALKKIEYVVAELAACQQANGDGYVLPVNKQIYEDIRRGQIQASGFSLNREWVPNYNLHKVLAGLRDAYRYAGNKQALAVERGMADYLAGVYKDLTPAQAQEILRAEYGGLNEVFADLSVDTGDPRYLELSRTIFHHDAILDPLEQGQDRLNGQHGNTQIPKIIGIARDYELTGEAKYRTGVQTFWDSVVNLRTFANGGHGEHEHFFPPAQFPQKLGKQDTETCNTYNMIKLTGQMFSWDPNAAEMDYVERGIINHLLSNIGRQPGEFGYFVSFDPIATKVFSKPEGGWWCCVGTGMENPARYGEQVYFHDATSLWVNLFIASELSWKERGIQLRQETAFPDSDTVRFTFKAAAPTKLALRIRHPFWCTRPEVKINGAPVAVKSEPSSYFTIDRVWKTGDVVTLRLPMTLRVEALPHSDGKVVSVLYGPNLLAGIVPAKPGAPDPAKERWDDHLKAPGQVPGTPPVFIAENYEALLRRFQPTGRAFAEFRSVGVVLPQDLTFVPLHRVYEEHYAVYLPFATPTEWKQREEEIRAAEAAKARLDAATLDAVQPGFQQSEVEHNFQSENSETGSFRDRKWRDARTGGWFSYDLAVDPNKPMALIVTYFGGDRGRTFDVLVDGKKVATQKLDGRQNGKFLNVVYALPADSTRRKTKVTVRLQGVGNSLAGGAYDLRVLQADAAKALVPATENP
ncbi:MAG TPA: glycoside hydrolase family 127 protein [Chthoniobacterales bacterium]